jgi:isopenicillin N synthase-like dioxygenase
MQFGENMQDLWISDSEVPGFKNQSLSFMHEVQGVSEKLMRCFARGLGFDDDYFINWHDVKQPNSQSTLRLIHYFETPETNDGVEYHRAGAHADWVCVTVFCHSCDIADRAFSRAF